MSVCKGCYAEVPEGVWKCRKCTPPPRAPPPCYVCDSRRAEWGLSNVPVCEDCWKRYGGDA